MFNDLNNPNASGHAAVDDIFAETDKTNQNSMPSDIETHRVGLANNGSVAPLVSNTLSENMVETQGGKKNYLRIVIIVVIVIAILGGAYFTYSQFFAPSTQEIIATTTPKVEKKAVESPLAPKTEDTGFVPVIPEADQTPAVESTTSETDIIPNTDVPTTEDINTPSVDLAVDSDSDGLTDAEEKIAGTNSNVIDTDNDGLSDYEEVKIYLTNSLAADTDGDSYLDGAEVKGGYDPNVKGGKLPGNTPKN
ncbi:MAG: thrombospondin type 3 repeat-containing protein [Patescibacteria group bacterium]